MSVHMALYGVGPCSALYGCIISRYLREMSIGIVIVSLMSEGDVRLSMFTCNYLT